MARVAGIVKRLALGAVALGLSCACAALTGNEQVSLASQGRYADLAAGLESDVARGVVLKGADQHALCLAYSRLKRYDRVFPCLERLDRLFAGSSDKSTRLFGLDDGTATAPLMRAEALIELGSYEEALSNVQAALDWFRRENANDMDILVDALAAKALAQLGLGRRADAERTAAELRDVKLGFLGSDAVGAKALAQARVAMALGRWKDVIVALDSDSTLKLRSFLHNLAGGAYLKGVNEWVWLELPRAYMYTKARLELGEAEAKTSLRRLLEVPELAANGGIYWLVLADVAGLAEKDGNDAEAEKLYLRAIEVVERQRRTINSEANKIGFAGDKQALYQRLLQVQLRQGHLQQAFQTAERGKARALVDLLAAKSGETFVAPEDPRRKEYAEILDRMALAELQEAGQDPAAIQRATRGAGSVQAKSLAQQLPGALSELVSVAPPDFAKVQGLLARDESLLMFYGSGRQLHAFVLNAGGVHAAEIRAEGLEDEVKRLRLALGRQDSAAPQLLRQLYARLIQPVKDHLSTTRLTIVPHGPLHYVPFAALNDGSADLIDRHSIRMLPNVSVLQYLKRASRVPLENMFVMGNPDLGDPKLDLPGAEFEAKQLQERFKVQRLLLRKQATRSGFRQFAPAAPLIHVASHGEFDAAKPLHSGLMLSAEGKAGGIDRLTVSDLYAMKLDAALVTLSACETGLGSVLTGDDVIGLTRGFLYAGAGTVIASLWSVDDDATAFLMLRMYEAFQDGKGDDFLRQAQLETRKKFPNPLFWAAFYRTGL
jgi:CHAT domain-containing protein